MWYQKNQSMLLDLKLISLTALVIMFPDNKLHEKWFEDLAQKEIFN